METQEVQLYQISSKTYAQSSSIDILLFSAKK